MKVEEFIQRRGSSDSCDFVDVEFTDKRNQNVIILRLNMAVTSIILAIMIIGIICKLVFR